MAEFKVGDRVRVYYVEGPQDGIVGCINAAGNLRVDFGKSIRGDDGELYSGLMVHPKQCRRLVKKERRRVWVNKGAFNEGPRVRVGWEIHFVKPPSRDYVEFIEVRPKSHGIKA